MAVYSISRFDVRPEARTEVEHAMHEYATYVRAALPDLAWSSYRDLDTPGRYVALSRADTAAGADLHRDAPGTRTFAAALAPLLAGAIEHGEYELVTSSDLAPRLRASRGRRPSPRRR